MTTIKNSSKSIGKNYPTNTGRLKIIGTSSTNIQKIALIGDSTIDNGFWVQKHLSYSKKTKHVMHQTALALDTEGDTTYQLANFAVDGVTTADLLNGTHLNRAVRDKDHSFAIVYPLHAAVSWQPEVVILSVGGNNYREALFRVLEPFKYQALFRITPEKAKPLIRETFKNLKKALLEDYKKIIDQLIKNNPKLNRIVLLSQYYPAITELAPYFIYDGFSQIAHAEGKKQTPFIGMEETMNELYREILHYAATKSKEIVFVDVTSSLNPLGGNHTMQIEPNERGSEILGGLIAHAVHHEFQKSSEDKQSILVMRQDSEDAPIRTSKLDEEAIDYYGVKKISQYISESRYRHLRLLFSPKTSLVERYESAYHAIVGKQFDPEYSGWFAFGLLDLSLITIAASYCWRAAINEELNLAFRVTAAAIAVPILFCRLVVGLTILAVFALPIFGLHQALKLLPLNDKDPVYFVTSEEIDYLEDDRQDSAFENFNPIYS